MDEGQIKGYIKTLRTDLEILGALMDGAERSEVYRGPLRDAALSSYRTAAAAVEREIRKHELTLQGGLEE